MISAAFRSVALFVWTRNRLLVGSAAIAYLSIFAAYDVLWEIEGKPLIAAALTFLRASPFLLPLVLLVSTTSLFAADIAGRESGFPRYFFALPLTAGQVVLPFMAYAVLVWVLLWGAAMVLTDGRVLAFGPVHLPVDVLPRQAWFPFMQLSLFAWVQALIWMPFARRWTRVVGLLGLTTVHAVAMVLVAGKIVPGAVLVTMGLVQVPLAHAVAVWGVARARRGDPPRKERRTGEGQSDHDVAPRPARTRLPFRSGLAAQSWFEWQLHGKSRWIAMTAIVAVTLSLGSVAAQSPRSLAGVAVGLAFVALVFVPALGPLFASFQSNNYEAFTMPSFFATLPLSAGEFAWAKMKAAAKSVTLMLAVVVLLVTGVSALTGVNQSLAALIGLLRERHGAFEAGALLALAVVGLVLLTLAGTMNSVCVALTGRRSVWWFVNAAIVLGSVGWVVASAWMGVHPEGRDRVLAALPTVLATLATAKLGGLALLIYLVGSRRHYTWSRLTWIGGCWLAAVASGLAMYLRYTPQNAGNSFTVTSALIVLVPILGIVGAPVAVHWNRCR